MWLMLLRQTATKHKFLLIFGGFSLFFKRFLPDYSLGRGRELL
jgi:hypothetical protein